MDYSNADFGQYDCSLEQRHSRNKAILSWIGFGVPWLWICFAIFHFEWFWTEAFQSLSEIGWKTTSEGCMSGELECQVSVGRGGVWWFLLASLLTGISVGPLVFAGLIITYRTKDVTKKWRDELWGLLIMINPSVIWGLLWLVCLPVVWGLWPYDVWWKWLILLTGLGWMGILPPIFTTFGFFSHLFNPKYTLIEQQEEVERLACIEEEQKILEQTELENAFQEELKRKKLETQAAEKITKKVSDFWDQSN